MLFGLKLLKVFAEHSLELKTVALEETARWCMARELYRDI